MIDCFVDSIQAGNVFIHSLIQNKQCVKPNILLVNKLHWSLDLAVSSVLTLAISPFSRLLFMGDIIEKYTHSYLSNAVTFYAESIVVLAWNGLMMLKITCSRG